MARTRFRTRLASSRHVMAGADVGDRQASPGDAPAAPPEPPGGAWSLSTYPHVDPDLSEEAAPDG